MSDKSQNKTIQAIQEHSAFAIAMAKRRALFLLGYILWFAVVTYYVNVLFNLFEIINEQGAAAFRWSNAPHILLFDQTTASLLQLPGYAVPLVLVLVAVAWVIYYQRTVSRAKKKVAHSIEKQMDELRDRINHYIEVYGPGQVGNFLIFKVLTRLKNQPTVIKPKPPAEQKQQYKNDLYALAKLEERYSGLDKSGQIDRFEEIKKRLEGYHDKELLDMVDDYIRERRFYADLLRATFTPVVVIIITRLIGTLLTH